MTVKKRMIQLVVIVCAICLYSGSGFAADDYTIITGKWQRSDGNYMIRVSDVQADGKATVEYFNPSPIHVAEASISTQKEYIQLFIKFQDKGYEGSTYRLYYYAKGDSLVGFYHQATMNRTYKVFFMRKTQ